MKGKFYMSAGLATIVIFVGVCLSVVLLSKREGVKIGYITNVVRHGFLIRNYNATISRGGLTEGSGTTGKDFHVHLAKTKNSMVDNIESIMQKGQQVVLKYKCSFSMPFFGRDYECYAISVESMRKGGGK